MGTVSNSPNSSVWIGFDPRMATAFTIAKYSLRLYEKYVPVHGIVLDELRSRGIYTRPTSHVVDARGNKQLWDGISLAPMSTEFSISRFMVPILAKTGMAMFCDCDVMFMDNVSRLFDLVRGGEKAVYCVKHDHDPGHQQVKMDNQIQTKYFRKNWSSVMVFNCDHPSNRRLTLNLVNSAKGKDLHGFCWLEDDEIGDLPPEWNYLVGHSSLSTSEAPAIVHFTNGLPDMEGYENQEFAQTWRAMRARAVGAR